MATKAKPQFENFSPSQFMRARRPELFSDSIVVSEPQLTRVVLDYHLHSLTSRKQESEFEHFCRRLAEKELCPNLLPQTGPTGGGDSKVDSETYPVADAIALRWYGGTGREASREASRERWAFAFSAKKKWLEKVRSDVEKIATTNRGYKVAYFMTNQYVKDQARAKIEAELSKKHGLDVRILDRTWILECIYNHNRIRLAVETLGLTSYDEDSRRKLGPQDAERQRDFEEVERQIEDPSRYEGVGYQLAEDCLTAAILSRGLERPRQEVEGRFSRADNIAQEVGNTQQQLRIAYARAWTAYWWYEDYEQLNQLYDRVEAFAKGSGLAHDLELLSNTWVNLVTAVRSGCLTEEAATYTARTACLRKELERLAADRERPNNALQAKTNLLLITLTELRADDKTADQVLRGLKEVLEKCEGLVGYPVEPLFEIVHELGGLFPDNAMYDALFEKTVALAEKRAGQGTVGCALLRRGYQKLKAGKKYEAIKLLAKAQTNLAMRESQGEFIAALVGCGLAYEAAGLLWAARSNMIIAASHSLVPFWEQGHLTPQALMCAQKLVWIELQLGRVPAVLEWMELASSLAGAMSLEGNIKEKYDKERHEQDMVLGILLLKTGLWELKWIDFLPTVLDRFGLINSWMASLYALGYESHLRSEGVIPEQESEEDVGKFFQQWLNQPASEDLPDEPDFLLSSGVTLRSFVIGCEIIIEARNEASSTGLAEVILGALEALMATALTGRVFPCRSKLLIKVQPSEFIQVVPQYSIAGPEEDRYFEVRHPALLQLSSPEDREKFRPWLFEFILKIVEEIAVIDNPLGYFERLAREDAGMDRSLSLSEVPLALGNILGEQRKLRLSDWERPESEGRFPLRRQMVWNQDEKPEGKKRTLAELKPGQGEPPEELFGVDQLKHRDVRVFTFINVKLWDRAEWKATLYLCSPEPNILPGLVIGFTNADSGRAIFRDLRSKLGDVDQDERLRVSIVTGIDKNHPHSYRVVIGANSEAFVEELSMQRFVLVSRINKMVPSDSGNLDRFRRSLESGGGYFILPGHFKPENMLESELFWDLKIRKQKIHIRPAWQIGENDPDLIALRPSDKIIIPAGEKDAPALKALKHIKSRNSRRQ